MAVINNSSNFNSITPAPALDGGTGVTNPTAHGILVAEGSSAFNPIVLGAGQVLIGTTAGDPVAAALTAGSGISISSVSGSITISSAANWVDQTTAAVTMVANTGYTSDDGATLVVFTLPTSANIGDFVEINGKQTGLYKVAQAAGQQCFYGNTSTTLGTGGSISSTLTFDCIRLRCLVGGATSSWVVVFSVGNFSVA